MKHSVSLFALSMLMVGAVDGIRNLPSIAIFGQQLVFFFIVASLVFLIPTGLVSAELCKQNQEDSGIYVWTKKAFGESFGLVSVWLQWINTMVWFPTCLTTLVGTFAYLISPTLAHNTFYLVCASLIAFWVMTWINLHGIKTSSNLASIFTFFGMVVPVVVVISMGLLWVVLGKPLALHLTSEAITPNLAKTGTWTSLTAIITAFLGMELAAVHVKRVHNAERLFPRALVIAVIVIMLTMGLGSLMLALIVPHHKILLVAGVVQAFSIIFAGFHVLWLEKVFGILLLFGSLGAMINWLISPANSLSQAAKDGFLPKSLARENKHGVPAKIFIAQAVVVSLATLAFFLMPSVNGSYWLLSDLSTELYVLMYIIMFLAAFKLLLKAGKIYIIPGKKIGAFVVCMLGLLGSLTAIVVGFFPPTAVDVGSADHFIKTFSIGLVVMLLPVLVLLLLKAKGPK